MVYWSGRTILVWLEQYGLTDAILPFLLIFAVLFAILQRVKVFGEKKNINVIVSLVIALLTVVPHVMGRYPVNADPISIMNRALPNISVLVIAIIMALILIGIFGGQASWIGTLSGIVALLAFGAVVYFFGSAAGWWKSIHISWWGRDTTALLVVILVFAILIYFITKEPGAGFGTAGKFKNMLDSVGDFFRGGGRH